MNDAFYDYYRLRVALVGTVNVAQTIAFIAEHERSTRINYFVVDDAPQNFSDKIKIIGRDQIADVVRGLDAVFMLTALNDKATCKMAHLIADCVKNENVFLSVAIVQSASKEFSGELNYLEKNLSVVINFEEQLINHPVEDFSYKTVHGIHSILDEEFYPYLVPVDGADLVDMLTSGRKTFVNFGEASGENPTISAVNASIDSPLIKKSLQNARSVFLNILGSDSLLMMEANEASTTVQEAMNPDGEFYFVVNLNEALGDKIFAIVFVRV